MFPDCFPVDFEARILPAEKEYVARQVYRAALSGEIDEDTFLSTYELVVRGIIVRRKPLDLSDPSTYSTSCFEDIGELRGTFRYTFKSRPMAIALVGITEPACGPCQRTRERTGKPGSHVDWWIYRDVHPERYFTKVDEHDA